MTAKKPIYLRFRSARLKIKNNETQSCGLKNRRVPFGSDVDWIQRFSPLRLTALECNVFSNLNNCFSWTNNTNILWVWLNPSACSIRHDQSDLSHNITSSKNCLKCFVIGRVVSIFYVPTHTLMEYFISN